MSRVELVLGTLGTLVSLAALCGFGLVLWHVYREAGQ